MIDLQKIVNDIHTENVERGWWTDLKTGFSIMETRNRGEMMMLCVSELCEAAEGFSKGLMDDHLPEYPMFDVELADTAIRIADMIGAEDGRIVNPRHEMNRSRLLMRGHQVDAQLMLIVRFIAEAMEHHRKGRITQYVRSLGTSLAAVLALADIHQIDIFPIIEAKRKYNGERADHKADARKSDNGKKY